MRRVASVLFPLLAIAPMLGIASGSAMAQNVGDSSTYFVDYYANNVAGAPDATVRVINDGEEGAPKPAGDLWAEFFVFDDSEELTTCCGCRVSPDGLLSESVQNQFTNHSLRGVVPPRGVIKLISSSNCLGQKCPGGPNLSRPLLNRDCEPGPLTSKVGQTSIRTVLRRIAKRKHCLPMRILGRRKRSVGAALLL